MPRWTAPSRSMRSPTPLQLDAAMDSAFAQHALPDAAFAKQIDSALLEHARAQGRFDLDAAAGLQHDGVDTFQIKQMRKCEARRPGADDADLRPAPHRYAFASDHGCTPRHCPSHGARQRRGALGIALLATGRRNLPRCSGLRRHCSARTWDTDTTAASAALRRRSSTPGSFPAADYARPS